LSWRRVPPYATIGSGGKVLGSRRKEERMGSSGLIRWGAIGLMLGGVVWVVLGLSAVLGFLQAIPGREDVVMLIIALLLTAAGLVGLHALQRNRYGLLGRAGFWITVLSLLARAVGAGVYLAGSSALAWISYPWGTIGMVVGLVTYGVATMRARMLSRWYGLALIVSMPLSLPLGAYGTMLFGLIMGVLGYALWSRRDADTGRQSPRVK
jgi:hypothetical protein